MMRVKIPIGGIEMGVPNANDKNKLKQETETVKGTMFSVGIVGAVILVTYFIVYGLYIVRI